MSGVGLYLADRVFEQIPDLIGFDWVRHGRQWWASCRMDGADHYRKDKTKAYIWNGRVWLHEEGGSSMTVEKWLGVYGGLTDRDIWKVLRGDGSYWAPRMRKAAEDGEEPEVRYVDRGVFEGMRRFPLEGCPLFRWMCTLWDEDKVREVWGRYNVTTDTYGRAVFWYVNREGQILFDKRIAYRDDGHRDKEKSPGRKYKIGDGYTGRCLFGECVKRERPDTEVCVVESEKTALVAALEYPDKKWVACGGKSNVRLADKDMVLYPDLDAVDNWRKSGLRVEKWWSDWKNTQENADLADKIVSEKLLVI